MNKIFSKKAAISSQHMAGFTFMGSFSAEVSNFKSLSLAKLREFLENSTLVERHRKLSKKLCEITPKMPLSYFSWFSNFSCFISFGNKQLLFGILTLCIWTASSEFGTYSLCEQRRFRRACASAQSRQNLRCSLIQAVSQEEPSDRKPDPWPLWMAGHAQLKFVMTECSKTQIRLTGLIWNLMTLFTNLITQQDLTVITGLYLYIDNQRVSLIFSGENSLVSLCMTEKLNYNFHNYCTFQKNVCIRRTNMNLTQFS